MRYFLATGYRPSPHAPKMTDHGYIDISFWSKSNLTPRQIAQRYKKAGVDLPPLGEKVFLSVPKYGKLAVFVHEPYDCFLLITSRSQRKAYIIASAFRAAATCFLGQPPCNDFSDYLLELSSAPKQEMRRLDLARLIYHSQGTEEEDTVNTLQKILGTGTGLDHVQIKDACNIAREAIMRPVILDALLHLEYSHTLVWGFMVGSFYDSHYSRDRRKYTRYQLERIYFENRFRYDSAFVSAFRGIECILGKLYFKKNEISHLLSEADLKLGTDFSSERHRSWYEVFSTKRKWWQYSDLITYYLKLRNAVSAHGNPSPPFIVMEDQVFEIQYLLRSMIADILIPRKEEM